jgi:hypothetical protein
LTTVTASELLGRLSLPFSLFGRRHRRGAQQDFDTDGDSEEHHNGVDGFIRIQGPGEYRQYEHEPHRKQAHKTRKLAGVVLPTVIVLFILWMVVHSQVQSYTKFDDGMVIAHVHAIATHVPHQVKVELTFKDNDGYLVDNTYLVSGDQWCVHTDIITFAPWLSIVDLHSGLKFMSIEGHYTDPALESHATNIIVPINSSDDALFNVVHAIPWVAPIVRATYGNCVFLQPGGSTYDLSVSENIVIAAPAK